MVTIVVILGVTQRDNREHLTVIIHQFIQKFPFLFNSFNLRYNYCSAYYSDYQQTIHFISVMLDFISAITLQLKIRPRPTLHTENILTHTVIF